MTSRERVFAALAHKQPDRCPVDLLLESTTCNTLMQYFHVNSQQELYDIFEADMQFVFPDSTLPPVEILPDGTWFNRFGCHMRRVKNIFCEYVEQLSYPLAYVQEMDDFKAYDKWPDATAYDWAHFSEKIGSLHDKRIIKLHAGGLYEIAWQLRGQEQFLMDMALDPEIPHYIMNKLCDYWCDYIRYAMEAAGDKIDIVYTYDDIATQTSLIMSPDMLREFVYPYHEKVNSVIKSYGKTILYHSCGAVFSQIGALKSLPIDILNPLQPMASGMDFSKIKEVWGDSLCFHGGVDVQSTLPHGTPEDVRNEVRRNIAVLGKNGGYILAPSHYIQNDTPIENILAMYDVKLRGYEDS